MSRTKRARRIVVLAVTLALSTGATFAQAANATSTEVTTTSPGKAKGKPPHAGTGKKWR